MPMAQMLSKFPSDPLSQPLFFSVPSRTFLSSLFFLCNSGEETRIGNSAVTSPLSYAVCTIVDIHLLRDFTCHTRERGNCGDFQQSYILPALMRHGKSIFLVWLSVLFNLQHYHAGRIQALISTQHANSCQCLPVYFLPSLCNAHYVNRVITF